MRAGQGERRKRAVLPIFFNLDRHPAGKQVNGPQHPQHRHERLEKYTNTTTCRLTDDGYCFFFFLYKYLAQKIGISAS